MQLPRARGARVAVVVAVVLLVASAAGAAVLVSGDDGATTEVLSPTASESATPTPTSSPTPSDTSSPPSSPAPAPATTTAPTPSTTAPGPTEEERDELDADDRLTTTGVGPLQVGMTYEEVGRASGYEVRVTDWLKTGGACVYVALVGIPEPEAVFMYGGDGVVRGFVLDETSARATKSGVRIGDTEQRVREVYGDRLQEQEYPIGDTGKKWLYVEPEGSGHQLVLWLKDGRVFTMSSGARQWAMMYEGCA